MRICSGKFERGMEAFHVQEGKNIKLATGTQLMAQDRAIVRFVTVGTPGFMTPPSGLGISTRLMC